MMEAVCISKTSTRLYSLTSQKDIIFKEGNNSDVCVNTVLKLLLTKCKKKYIFSDLENVMHSVY
jgi:hypothetical protein